MFAAVSSFGLSGMSAYHVSVEVDFSRGMPGFSMVGLPDAAVKEARDRVQSALRNSGHPPPVGRVVVNLAPADVKKFGSWYDLPLFVGMLAAAGMIPPPEPRCAFLGELSLSGQVCPVAGVLPMVLEARERGFHRVFVPAANGAEAAAVGDVQVIPVESAAQLLSHLDGACPIQPVQAPPFQADSGGAALDFADVKGQESAKRALEIAAAGGHCILLIGPPGSGKSMLAKRLPSILPPLTLEEAVESTKLHSIAGVLPGGSGLLTCRPFRSPHHTASPASLTGGGANPKPGELSLAHNGVLFLDELPEFPRTATEVLRQPMEDGVVSVSRVNAAHTYPCSAMVVGAMNPCKCGYYGHPSGRCTCTPLSVRQYLSRVSGPLLDRFDLHQEVMPVDYESLSSSRRAESSSAIRARVQQARQIQEERYRGLGVRCNARLTPALLAEFCTPTPGGKELLGRAFESMGLSGRAYDRILKVARTIADLEGSPAVDTPHIAQAVQYRALDRKYWSERR